MIRSSDQCGLEDLDICIMTFASRDFFFFQIQYENVRKWEVLYFHAWIIYIMSFDPKNMNTRKK